MSLIETNRIYLVGLMGVGKSTIGRWLSKFTRYQFFDTDTEIQRHAGTDIPWIFDIEGEQGFRVRESLVLDELSSINKCIIATGGGVILSQENRQIMQQTGLCIYLYAPVDLLVERTKFSKTRPLLQGVDRRETLESLMRDRDHLYRKAAHFTVRTKRGSPKRMANKLIAEINKYERNNC